MFKDQKLQEPHVLHQLQENFQNSQQNIIAYPQIASDPNDIQPRSNPKVQSAFRIGSFDFETKQINLKNRQPIKRQENLQNQSSKFSSSDSEESSQEDQGQANSRVDKKKKLIPTKGTYRKYSRITPEIKERLIQLIARQNMSIKDASMRLKINYSSAKFIFSQYRDKKLHIIDREFEKDHTIKDELILKKIEQNEESYQNGNRLLVKCSSGGKFEAETERIFCLAEICQIYQYPFVNQSQQQKIQN